MKPLLDDAIIVCHNAPFDLGFVSSEFSRLGQGLPPLEVIDTLLLAREHFDFDSNSLQAIADHMMIDRSDAHRALADALTTRDVLEHFLVKLKRLPVDELVYVYSPPVAAPAALNLPPLIEEAFASKKRLFIRYVDKKGDETQRWITPKQVLALNDYIYVAARCHLRGALCSADDLKNNPRFELGSEIPSRHFALLGEHSLSCFSSVSNSRGALQCDHYQNRLYFRLL